jgi:hypothetical protein
VKDDCDNLQDRSDALLVASLHDCTDYSERIEHEEDGIHNADNDGSTADDADPGRRKHALMRPLE